MVAAGLILVDVLFVAGTVTDFADYPNTRGRVLKRGFVIQRAAPGDKGKPLRLRRVHFETGRNIP